MIPGEYVPAESYNELLPIAAASREYKRIQGDRVVDRLLSIIAAMGLEEQLGIRLLHKHNDTDCDELMVETAEIDDEGFCLSTRRLKCGEVADAVPNSWREVAGRFVPVEYSQRSLVNEDIPPDALQAALARIGAALRSTGTSNLLGPCLNYSASVSACAPTSSAALLEKTDFENVANVVRFVDRNSAEFTNSAKTKWHASYMIDGDGKKHWLTACNCFCSVFPSGGHEGTKTHRYNPSENE
ncbi:hypothetical protein [Caulobacter sp. S45]|uniref:hypothetical protein n=1 Tax=Caulobacter sp. S45 TaxID=1641861 RepID=UPI00131B7B5C|nr:hypothetical protein [Caulobacter sp. S45]